MAGMEILREIKNRDHGLPSDNSFSQRTVLCGRCHMGFFVNFPPRVDMEEVNAFLNMRYPKKRGPCYHPVYETVEIFEGEIRPRSSDRLDPALYQRTNPKGRLPNRPR